MRNRRVFALVGSFLLIVLVAIPEARAQTDGACFQCHAGIEDPIHPQIPGAVVPATGACVACHMNSDPFATTLPEAHNGMYPNPAAFDPANPNGPLPVCKGCHFDKYERIQKSLHGTSTGVITHGLWANNAIDSLVSRYANFPVTDTDGTVPANAVASLEQVPAFDPVADDAELDEHAHLMKDYLRKECLRCHVWNEGKKRTGDYRSGGCAACHMVYGDDGLYHGGDPTIPSATPDHAMHHRITRHIPAYQCAHCHNRGARIGVSYHGQMESDAYGSPWQADGTKQGKLHGKHYNFLEGDVHFERGMHCIDCHDHWDVMGDGNIYTNKQDAVAIECEDCHGTPDTLGDLVDARGNTLTNVERKPDGTVTLTSKVTGAEHNVIQLALLGDQLPEAMSIDKHMEKMECYACHSTWAARCYGCHAKLDLREEQYDWLLGEETPGKWEETRSFLRWDNPALGINSDAEENKVAPFVTGCQVIFTLLKEDGSNRLSSKIYRSPASTSETEIYSISHAPVNPHTTQPKARTCDSCHDDEYALGLGTDVYNAARNGLDFPYDLQEFVREDGTPIQGVSLQGARPFNAEEMARIRAVNGDGTIDPTPVPTNPMPEDIDWDGVVNAEDLLRLLAQWQVKNATK